MPLEEDVYIFVQPFVLPDVDHLFMSLHTGFTSLQHQFRFCMSLLLSLERERKREILEFTNSLRASVVCVSFPGHPK